jgi:hypothetical protein
VPRSCSCRPRRSIIVTPSCVVIAWISWITTPTGTPRPSSRRRCTIPWSWFATLRCTLSPARPAGPTNSARQTWYRTSSRCWWRTRAQSCATRPFPCCFALPTGTLVPDKRSRCRRQRRSRAGSRGRPSRARRSTRACSQGLPAPSEAQGHTGLTAPLPRDPQDPRRGSAHQSFGSRSQSSIPTTPGNRPTRTRRPRQLAGTTC